MLVKPLVNAVGQIVEIDAPTKLLKEPDSEFRKLAVESGLQIV